MSRDAQGSCTMAASIAPASSAPTSARSPKLWMVTWCTPMPSRASSENSASAPGVPGATDPDGLAGEIGERLDRVLLRRGHEERDGRRRGEAEDESRRRPARVAERKRSVERRGGERDAPAPECLRREGLRAKGLEGDGELFLGEVAFGRGHAQGQVFRIGRRTGHGDRQGRLEQDETRDHTRWPFRRSAAASGPATSAMSRAMRSAASGMARVRARSPMAASAARSAKSRATAPRRPAPVSVA